MHRPFPCITLRRGIMLCLCVLCLQGLAHAQFVPQDTVRSADSNRVEGIEYHEEEPDSLLKSRVYIFRYRPTHSKINAITHPTLDPTGAQFSDPLDALNGNYYLGKGVVGEPNYALFPTPEADYGLRLLPPVDGGYSLSPLNINLYQTQTPYTRLNYQSSMRADHQVGLSHTQNIMPGWNAAFDYHLFNPEGVYTNSSVKNHYLYATTNYFSRDSRLQASGGVVWQAFDFGENGGLSDDTYFTEQLQTNRAGIPVVYDQAASRHRKVDLFGHATYSLARQFDSLTPAPTHLLNLGVVGIDAAYSRHKQRFSDSTLWHDLRADLFWSNDAYPDHRWRNPLKITAGLKLQRIDASIDGYSPERDLLLGPFARAEVALGSGNLTGEAEWMESDGREADYRMHALLTLPMGRSHRTVAELSATTFRRHPDVRMAHDAAIQGLTLASPTTSTFVLRLRHADLLALEGRASRLHHHQWYDTTLVAVEGTTPFWLAQASLIARLHAGWMHLDMQQLVQYSTDADQMPVPLWATKNSLYADVHLFRHALRAQIGADVRYHTPFFAPAYSPVIGAFVHQDQTEVGGYLWADLFVTLQVKRASIYFKAGHLNALLESTSSYFLLPHYPGQKFGLFWGLTWHFFD